MCAARIYSCVLCAGRQPQQVMIPHKDAVGTKLSCVLVFAESSSVEISGQFKRG